MKKRRGNKQQSEVDLRTLFYSYEVLKGDEIKMWGMSFFAGTLAFIATLYVNPIFNLPTYALAASFIITTALSYASFNLFASKPLKDKLRSMDQSEWKQEDRDAYAIGKSSKNWLPYLKSYVQPTAYLTAYKVGLEDAMNTKEVPTKKANVKA